MQSAGIDALLLSLGADLPWCTGYEAMPLERPTVLVLPVDDVATLVVPRLEAPRVEHDEELFELRPWNETEDAVEVVAKIVGDRAHLAISDRSWASLLLGLQHALPSARFERASTVTSPLRAVKDDFEIAALQAAGAAADRVATQLMSGEIGLIGRREADVSKDISARLIAEGHARVNFAIVGSGPNAASPHHEPGERVIQAGETVVCDFGGTYQLDGDVGYCSDITRTVVTGEPSAEQLELYAVLQEAQAAAVNAVGPGLTCQDIDRVAREIITAAGYGEAFFHRTGHGIGVEEHEDPYIVEGNATTLMPGHAFSIEPGIYLTGRMGARLEDIVVVTDDGVLSCNNADHDLHFVDA
jgi:Xaa-Pro aminopeptidase